MSKLDRREFLKLAAVTTGTMITGAGVLAGAGASEFPSKVPASTAGRPNIVLAVLDTVRADRMSCYGYERETSPNIDRFAESARRFSQVLSPGSWTLPSHASLFTGLPVRAHGVDWQHQFLDSDFPTMAEHLYAAGYQTVGLSSNSFVSPAQNFHQGFGHYVTLAGEYAGITVAEKLMERLGVADVRRPAESMHRHLGKWFEDQYLPEEPFFLFLNYIEAHDPYRPPVLDLTWSSRGTWDKWRKKDWAELMRRHTLTGLDALSPEDIAELSTLYDEEVRYTDRKVGELLGFLESNGLLDNSIVVITSDHGEHFGEHHMMNHLYSVYEPLVRVPLLVRQEGRFAPGVESSVVQTQDVFPTILEAAGVEWPRRAAHTCRSLREAGGGEPRLAVAEDLGPLLAFVQHYSEAMPHLDMSRWLRELRAVQVGDLKLVRSSLDEKELYDVAADPLETKDLAESRPEDVARLDARLSEWLASVKAYVPPPPTHADPSWQPASREALRGLGYLK